MPKSLKTKTSAWTAVFRRIVQQLSNDPDFRRVVGPQNLRSWAGVPTDKAPLNPTATAPIVRLTPQPMGVEWLDPSSQYGTLNVMVELAIQSLCVDDVIDLWDTIVTALESDRADAAGTPFFLDLGALGATTGEILFSDPAIDPRPDASPEGYFYAQGRFHLAVQRPI